MRPRSERWSAEIAQNQTERALLEKALEAAKNSAAKGRANFEEMRAEALELSARLAEFKDKHPFRLLADEYHAGKAGGHHGRARRLHHRVLRRGRSI